MWRRADWYGRGGGWLLDPKDKGDTVRRNVFNSLPSTPDDLSLYAVKKYDVKLFTHAVVIIIIIIIIIISSSSSSISIIICFIK